MRRFAPLALTAAVVAVMVFAPGVVQAKGGGASAAWHPSAYGGLDCNGFSPVQKTYRTMMCTEIAANDENGFEDNGHYVGHDEPDLGFFSTTPGSGNSMTYRMILPRDPLSTPTAAFGGSTSMFELTPAIWYGMTLCDNESYPEGTKICPPDSDSNVQVPPRPDHAGAAFMELQFYPPGYAPVISCDNVHWCAALTIDSLQGNFGALHGPGSPPDAVANPNCTEPVNFAFLTHNGKPVGPPGPDKQTNKTFTPTRNVLTMNPGDSLRVSMHDTPDGFLTQVDDLTTGDSGFMTASAQNRFRHILWDPVKFTCKGAPYAFHPMYNTARPPLANGQPTAWTTWAAHTDNIAYDVETGHFEPPDTTADASLPEDGAEDPPASPSRRSRRVSPRLGTSTSTATRTSQAPGRTDSRTHRRPATSARRRHRRAGRGPTRPRGSRPTCRASRRPTTAARSRATTTPARAARTRRPARSIPGTTC
jgi:hypothetical protein